MTVNDVLKVDIRQTNREDAAATSKLLRGVFVETYGHLLDDEVLQEHLDVYLSEVAIAKDMTDSIYFVAEGSKGIDGVLKLCFDDEHKAEIAKLYVGGWARAQNIGSNLITTALTCAKEHSASHIWLNVWKENTKAIKFYEKHNFTIVGNTHVYVGESVFDDYVMERIL